MAPRNNQGYVREIDISFEKNAHGMRFHVIYSNERFIQRKSKTFRKTQSGKYRTD